MLAIGSGANFKIAFCPFCGEAVSSSLNLSPPPAACQHLEELAGRISSSDALHLLGDASQDNTQWSVVYHMTSGDLDIVMGRDYSVKLHSFQLDRLDP